MSDPPDITLLLQRAEAGDREAENALYLHVRDDLRRIARSRMQRVGVDATATGLIDEAFCRIVGKGVTVWKEGDRRKFFGYMARKMHDLLVEAARARGRRKRGEGREPVPLEEELVPETDRTEADLLLDLQQALNKLEGFAEHDALLFRLRYYLGLTFEETAAILDISETKTKKSFERIKAWLRRELREYHHDA